MNTDRPEVINGIETGRDNNRLTPKSPRLMLNSVLYELSS
jgi:hypothetical protein